MLTLSINEEGLNRLREDYRLPLDKDLATRIGVNKSTLSRVLEGKSRPGDRFIASILTAFPVKFEDIFDVVEVVAIPTPITRSLDKAA